MVQRGVQIMIDLLRIIASAVLWRYRGILGWQMTWLFAAVQAWTVWPVAGYWSLLYFVWIAWGELSGWKPKLIWDYGDWWGATFKGFLIGGVGAISVPLSTWMARVIPEPQIKALQNQKAYSRPAWDKYKLLNWDEPKHLFNWRNSWNEVYMGAAFSLILTIIIGAI